MQIHLLSHFFKIILNSVQFSNKNLSLCCIPPHSRKYPLFLERPQIRTSLYSLLTALVMLSAGDTSLDIQSFRYSCSPQTLEIKGQLPSGNFFSLKFRLKLSNTWMLSDGHHSLWLTNTILILNGQSLRGDERISKLPVAGDSNNRFPSIYFEYII